jgi:2-polyprenyl-3-methyl-5-hydroxy-6-metoxy-1,4-benzoquinol methylase
MSYRDKKDLINSLITSNEVVLDVGFWGQGVPHDSLQWPHRLIKERAKDVYGVDIDFDKVLFPDETHYFKQNAEVLSLPIQFDVIFAGDIIEHFSNPGLFLDSCARLLKPSGKLIITTPNCFNLFSITEKIMKSEPTVNKEHTCYFNSKTLTQLLTRHGYTIELISFLYDLNALHAESLKKRILNRIYWLFGIFTNKFYETLVVISRPS